MKSKEENTAPQGIKEYFSNSEWIKGIMYKGWIIDLYKNNNSEGYYTTKMRDSYPMFVEKGIELSISKMKSYIDTLQT